MLVTLLKKFFIDISVVAVACAVVFVLTIFHHGAIKPYTREVATIAPLVFAFAALSLLVALSLGNRLPLLKRLTFDLCVASLFVPLAMLKAETPMIPFEYSHGAGVEEQTARIASNNDWDRYRAWARFWTMNTEDKDEVARHVAGLLTANDAGTRASARLTLDVSLRKHLLAALTTLGPDLKLFLTHKGTGLDKERADLAGAFAKDFVAANVTAIRKAIDPKQRLKLPAGGLEALVLALAADDLLGEPFLRDVAQSDDEELRPLAANALRLKDGSRTGH